MLRCGNFIVMSFPFITEIERNELKKEKQKTKIETPIQPPTPSKPGSQYESLVCLSNLEEIAYLPKGKNKKHVNKTPVDYDKYLDYFE